MKKITTGFILMALLLCSKNVLSQKDTKKFSFGFGLEGGLVTGDYKEVFNAAGGITLRGSYKVGPGFATLTSGGVIYTPKDINGEDLKVSLQIPVKAGYKYIIKKHFFVMGELGFSSFKQYFEGVSGDVESTSSSGFTYAPAIGVQTGAFELSLRYESTSISSSTLSAAFLRLGFNF